MFRIYPAVFATVGIFTLLFWTTGACLTNGTAFEPWNVVQNALLIKFDINGVMWSLQMELLAVSLIFVGYVLVRVFGLWERHRLFPSHIFLWLAHQQMFLA